ncbi:formin-like protein isoform X2 [Macrosteles quadrilineatus]|uniref:formin-like protein isoform X2 n=1 Tax=Macrosteles quadrilineatus TaxID=74068 RepID=UPI0023E0DDC8|nr:formin-like protein isoform X2 [Macrosteles quadrilineatus]
MGSTQSSKVENPPLPVEYPRTNNVRASIRSARVPMPDQNELERRFNKVLASMDLPPDKARVLRQYDDEKKWDIICDQERVQAKDPPAHYLNKLRTYLDPTASRSSRKRKIVGDATSTQVLKDLEISLRTNHIEWVREFLNEHNQGLNSLVDYLSFRLIMLRHEQESRSPSEERINASINGSAGAGVCSLLSATLPSSHCRTPLEPLDSPDVRKRSRHAARLRMGDPRDDIHVCIMCLRAIMNNKYGFNMVIQHTEAINSIALSLIHKSLRTKALVLELLAAICLVKGGHEIILSAFDNFKEVCHEKRRFQTLMEYFINYEVFHIEFMVACMQFINIIVHSVEDMNYRVHLQYEFTKLGLDEYLERLRNTESEDLKVYIVGGPLTSKMLEHFFNTPVQFSAYLDNVFDVAALMEDSETKTTALERVAELEDEVSHAHDRLAEMERESLAQLATLEAALGAARSELEEVNEGRRKVEEEVHTLRKQVHSQSRQSSMLEDKIQELISRTSPDSGVSSALSSCSTSSTSSCNSNSTPAPPPPPAVISPPPPPPPPCKAFSPPAPPPPVGMMLPPGDATTIKRKVQTKYKLPSLNWIALKPNQVRGTLFNELDDDKLYKVIDFAEFEEMFKLPGSGGNMLTNGSHEVDGLGLSSQASKRFKKPETVSLLEHTRLRNIAISRRKIEMPVDKVIAAVNALDLKQVSLENVELLQRMVPTDQEAKAYREYQLEKKDICLLTEEDRFLMQLTRVERLSSKLAIMAYMGNFLDNVHLITPQVHAIISASSSVRTSQKLRRVLEVVLAFGNYLNSAKRGPAYGFKLQSLDTLGDTKSSDKRCSLLHFIVDTIREKFPELRNFDTELLHVDKAAMASLETIVADVAELEKGMEAVRKECSKERANATVLTDFLTNSEEKLKRLKAETKLAQDNFKECLEYFGESTRTSDANTFFLLFVRFIRAFKAAEQENEQRRRLEMAAAQSMQNNNSEEVIKRNKLNQKRQQEKKLLHQDEVYNGALEDILLGLKSEPYRRADAVRRSQRRRIDSNRLSRTQDELEI